MKNYTAYNAEAASYCWNPLLGSPTYNGASTADISTPAPAATFCTVNDFFFLLFRFFSKNKSLLNNLNFNYSFFLSTHMHMEHRALGLIQCGPHTLMRHLHHLQLQPHLLH
jgi:hypothetical protein